MKSIEKNNSILIKGKSDRFYILVTVIILLSLAGCMSTSRLTSQYISTGNKVCIENDNLDLFASSEKKITINDSKKSSIYIGSPGIVKYSGRTTKQEYGFIFNDPYLEVEFGAGITLTFEWGSLNFQDAYFLKEAKVDGIRYDFKTSGGFWYLKECK